MTAHDGPVCLLNGLLWYWVQLAAPSSSSRANRCLLSSSGFDPRPLQSDRRAGDEEDKPGNPRPPRPQRAVRTVHRGQSPARVALWVVLGSSLVPLGSLKVSVGPGMQSGGFSDVIEGSGSACALVWSWGRFFGSFTAR